MKLINQEKQYKYNFVISYKPINRLIAKNTISTIFMFLLIF